MSFWKVAAAQYEPRKTSLTEQVAHHLEVRDQPPPGNNVSC